MTAETPPPRTANDFGTSAGRQSQIDYMAQFGWRLIDHACACHAIYGGVKMQTIKLPDQDTPMNFTQARLTAVGKADEILKKPVIVAWKDDRTGKFAPAIPGGTGDRWHVYGESNEGMLELQVADAFHFIFTDAECFEEPDTNLASLEDNGTKFLCLNDACTEEDRQRLGYFPGGGLGG